MRCWACGISYKIVDDHPIVEVIMGISCLESEISLQKPNDPSTSFALMVHKHLQS